MLTIMLSLELLRTRYDNALVQVEKLRKRVEEYEKTTRSSDSVETEKDSGFVPGGSSQSIVDHTNNVNKETINYLEHHHNHYSCET
jgi:hypothetical protein